MRHSRYTIFLCTAFLNALTCCSWADDAAESAPVELAMESDLTRIVVALDFKDATRRFLVDTGASIHVFASHLLPVLDGEVQRSNPDAHGNILAICPAQDIQVQGLRDCRSAPAAVADLSGFSSTRIDGVLGMPFLCDRVLEIDFDDRRLRILTDTADRKGERLEVLLDADGLPRLTDVTVDRMPFVCLLDTGMNSACSLNAKMFDLLRLAGSITEVRWVTSTGVHGDARTQMGVASTVSIGAFTFSNVPVVRAAQNKVGIDLIRRFNLAVDFPRRELVLDKSDAFDAPFLMAERPANDGNGGKPDLE